jgi:predicted RNase H-like nuclease
MAWVAGIDGCRAGWFVVLRQVSGARQTVHHCVPCFGAALRLPEKPEVIALDMPIGLLDQAARGGRECDRLARQLLGSPRASSVFSPPARIALRCMTFASASAANRASSEEALGISRQSFALSPKLRDIDAHVTPRLQGRVREVHPELCFYEMNGRMPMPDRKKTRQGRRERERLLLRSGFTTVAQAISQFAGSQIAPDDIIDAYAACWTAERIFNQMAVVIPTQPPTDSRGLRMEIIR